MNGLTDTLRTVAANRFARFLVVGVVNTVFGYAVFWLLLFLGMHYSMALLVGTVLGVLFNFKSTGSLVFGSRDNRLLVRFCGTYLILYACNLAGIGSLVHAGFSPQAAGAILLLPMALLGYTLNRRFVFRPS